MTRHVHHVLVSGNDIISLKSRLLIFVYLYTRRTEYDIKSKYPKEYSAFDKVGRENLLFRFSFNRILISYLISKQERLNTFIKERSCIF